VGPKDRDPVIKLGSAGNGSVHAQVSRSIKDERQRVAFSFHPLLIGGNPFTASAIYTLIPYRERGLAGLIDHLDGTLRCGAQVEQVIFVQRRVRGVRLVSGEMIPANIVVSNADSADLRRRRTDRTRERARYSMGSFLWYFGTD
jgi:phytoene desaturase